MNWATAHVGWRALLSLLLSLIRSTAHTEDKRIKNTESRVTKTNYVQANGGQVGRNEQNHVRLLQQVQEENRERLNGILAFWQEKAAGAGRSTSLDPSDW